MTQEHGTSGAPPRISTGMTMLSWIALAVGLLALFVAWDFLFCGGRRCRRFTDSGPGQP